MLYRRGLREVDAIRFDGSEHSARAISLLKGVSVSFRPDATAEVVTIFGRKFLSNGQWITRDRATGALRVFDHDDFLVEHTRIKA